MMMMNEIMTFLFIYAVHQNLELVKQTWEGISGSYQIYIILVAFKKHSNIHFILENLERP